MEIKVPGVNTKIHLVLNTNEKTLQYGYRSITKDGEMVHGSAKSRKLSYDNLWDDFKAMCGRVWECIKDLPGITWDWFKNLFEGILGTKVDYVPTPEVAVAK